MEYENLKDLCENRSSCREFKDENVPDDIIEKIRKIAYTSPYISKRRNWSIMAIDEKPIIESMAIAVEKCIEEFKEQLKEDIKDSFLKYSKNFTFFRNAPVILVPVFRQQPFLSVILKDNSSIFDSWEKENYIKSISCVSMLILLAVESLGLGSCYMTGPMIAKDRLREVVGVKSGYDIGAILPIGYKNKSGGK